VQVTDARGCTTTAATSITQPSALQASLFNQVNVSCYGLSDGAVSVIATGGTLPYSGTGAKNNLAAGTYAYTVTDGNGCSSLVSAVITEPALLQMTAVPGIINCFGGTTQVLMSATGGTLPYTGTGTLAAVSTGNYTYNVTDANGCSVSAAVHIPQPALLTTSISGSNITCFGTANGSVAVTAQGGTLPYTYTWNNGASQPSQTGLQPGNYSVVVGDARGCTSTSSITLTQPDLLQTALSAQSNVSCNGGSNGAVTVLASGGTLPYTGTGVKSNLSAGNYTYTVTDANGCTSAITAE
jgi:hypothetical protein